MGKEHVYCMILASFTKTRRQSHVSSKNCPSILCAGGWLGNRPPTPPLTSWNLIPKRLCLSMDPFKRKFFSHWNTSQCEWVASDFSMKFRANHPRAIGTKFNGFDSKSETDSGLKSREIMPFSKL